MQYLEFEKPIEELNNKLIQARELADLEDVDASKTINDIENQILKAKKEIYNNLSPWQKVQLSRHPDRPYSLDYINALTNGDFVELHGDRNVKDDKAMIGGWGTIDGKTVMFIGQQKGRNTKENLYRNFGMMRPEGYRKAIRVMKIAEKFNLPIISLLDTIGAYPGIGAEERGQGEAIAKNLITMSGIEVPIISVVIGEGASGGALGIGVCDRMLMMENTWYSVISPEGCASILFRDAKRAEDAAEALKPTPKDLLEIGICDRIIEEPNGGAHRDFEASCNSLKNVLLDEIKKLSSVDKKDFLQNRIEKYAALGFFEEIS
mgnify:CR=1 FL=1